VVRRINSHPAGDAIEVDVQGPLYGERTGRQLEETVEVLIRAGHRRVLLNLGGASVLDAAAIGRLTGLVHAVRDEGGEVKLVHVPRRVRQMLKALGLSDHLGLQESDGESSPGAGPGSSAGCLVA
jgi:anti-sigma B factor antagonist